MNEYGAVQKAGTDKYSQKPFLNRPKNCRAGGPGPQAGLFLTVYATAAVSSYCPFRSNLDKMP